MFGVAHAAGFYTWAQGKTFHGQHKDDVKQYIAPVFDYLADEGRGDGWQGGWNSIDDVGATSVPESELKDTVTGKAAAKFLRNYDGNDPFFMAVGIFKPHLRNV